MTVKRPAEAFPVQTYIAEELEARGWTLDDLDRESGIGRATIDAMMTFNLLGIDTEIAEGLERAFGVSAQFWRDTDTFFWVWFQSKDAAR